MSKIQYFKYATAITVEIDIYDFWLPELITSDLVVKADIQISKDSAGSAALHANDTLTWIDRGRYTLTLQVAELTAATVTLSVIDASDPKVFADRKLIIHTFGHVSAHFVSDFSVALATASGIVGLDSKVDTITAYEVAVLEDTGTTIPSLITTLSTHDAAAVVTALFAATGITVEGTLTVQKMLKILSAWIAGNWRDKPGDATKQELLDADDASTVILEQALKMSTPYRTITVKI